MAEGQAAVGANADDASLAAGAAKIEGMLASPEGDDNDADRETPQDRGRKPRKEELDDDDDLLGDDEDADDDTDDEDDSEDTDDDAPEDGDEDSSDDSDDDEDGDDDRRKPKTRKITVKNDDGKDEVVEVTDKELEAGYMRQRDYTRKTMAHSEAVKKFRTEIEEPLRAERQQYSELLGKLEEAVQALTPEEDPDWERLKDELDPDQFTAVFAQHQSNKAKLAKIQAERQRLAQKMAEDSAAQLREHLARETELLLEALPAWKKPEIAAREKAKLIQFAKQLGYSDEDLAQVTDHRILLVLNDAMQYRSLKDKQKKTRDKIRKVSENSKPGSKQPNEGRRTKSTEARKRLAKTGSLQDGAAAIFELLPD